VSPDQELRALLALLARLEVSMQTAEAEIAELRAELAKLARAESDDS
jgi:hypothetical protein